MLRRPGGRTLVACAAGNAFLVALWTLSRTTGIPLGPGAWTPEAVAFPYAFSTVAEILAVTVSLLLLAPATRSRLEVSKPRLGPAAVLLTTAVVVAFSAGGAAMAHAQP